jgi:ATP-dependent helicase/nuclease subunit B
MATSATQTSVPTQLEDFGECPQKFFLKHILGVRDIDDPDHQLQITPRDKGILDHAILERFYQELTRTEFGDALSQLPKLLPLLAERLDRMIDEEFDRFETTQAAFNRTIRAIERETTRRILRDFIVRDFDDLAENGLFPEHFEYRFGSRHREAAVIEHPEPFIVTANGVPVRIEGTIDRIDRGEGRLRVIDYKSGKALRHKQLEQKILRGTRLQLPLYALAVAEFFEAPIEQVDGAIKPLVYAKGSKHEFTLKDTHAELDKTLALFVSSILGGSFPAYPDDEDINSCKYCPVRYACRTKHDADERRAVRRHPDARTLLTSAADEGTR